MLCCLLVVWCRSGLLSGRAAWGPGGAPRWHPAPVHTAVCDQAPHHQPHSIHLLDAPHGGERVCILPASQIEPQGSSESAPPLSIQGGACPHTLTLLLPPPRSSSSACCREPADAGARRYDDYQAPAADYQRPPPREQNWRSGDWECPGCRFHNFASRDRCFRCGELEPLLKRHACFGLKLKHSLFAAMRASLMAH